MNDTVADQHIWSNDLCAVDKDHAVVDGYSQVCAVHGGQRSAIHQAGAVTDSALNHVVGKDAGKVRGAEVAETRANGLESCV